MAPLGHNDLKSYVSVHGGSTVLLSGFAINRQQNQVPRQPHLHDRPILGLEQNNRCFAEDVSNTFLNEKPSYVD